MNPFFRHGDEFPDRLYPAIQHLPCSHDDTIVRSGTVRKQRRYLLSLSANFFDCSVLLLLMLLTEHENETMHCSAFFRCLGFANQ